MMLHALALGAEKNHHHENEQGRTPLIQAVLSVRTFVFRKESTTDRLEQFQKSVAAAEFLLVNNANVNLADQQGRTALHYATELTKKGRG